MKKIVQTTVHVCSFDPAISYGDGGTPAEWASLRDPALLKLVDGMQPRRYTLRPLSWKRFEWVGEAGGISAQCARAFRASVARVTYPDGSAFEPANAQAPGFFAMSEDDLEQFSAPEILEIGHIAVESASVPFGLRLAFSEPPSSRRVRAARELHSLYVARMEDAIKKPSEPGDSSPLTP